MLSSCEVSAIKSCAAPIVAPGTMMRAARPAAVVPFPAKPIPLAALPAIPKPFRAAPTGSAKVAYL